MYLGKSRKLNFPFPQFIYVIHLDFIFFRFPLFLLFVRSYIPNYNTFLRRTILSALVNNYNTIVKFVRVIAMNTRSNEIKRNEQ